MINNQQKMYKQCSYSAQGFLECKRGERIEKYSVVDSKVVIEPFVETLPVAINVLSQTTNKIFTERATSQSIWDRTSAETICAPLCSRFNQTWTQGFRNVGGSVCYCQDTNLPTNAAPTITAPMITTPTISSPTITDRTNFSKLFEN